MKAVALLSFVALATASPLLAERQDAVETPAAATAALTTVESFPTASATATVDPFEDLMDAYDALPTIPPIIDTSNGAVSAISNVYDPDAAADAAAASILETADDESDTLSGRSIEARGSCNPQALGNAPTVSPDTAAAFLANPDFTNAANNAQTPTGYFPVTGWKNLKNSAQSASLQTTLISVLKSYNVEQCAEACTARPGCVSFNIFFERDPSLFVDSKNCPIPPSYTRIKCTLFSTPLVLSQATNSGEGGGARFQTVIAGSNAYTTAPQSIAGFTGPVDLGDKTIAAPTADKTYMGVYAYPANAAYDPNVCATVCNSVSAYNQRHAAAGVAPRICRFFDAFMAYKNGLNGVLTCTLYTQPYDASFATNPGQTRSGDFYGFGHSYSYSLAV